MFNPTRAHSASIPGSQSYPWSPDLLSIMNCMAEEEGDPPAADLLAMGYHAAVGLPPPKPALGMAPGAGGGEGIAV